MPRCITPARPRRANRSALTSRRLSTTNLSTIPCNYCTTLRFRQPIKIPFGLPITSMMRVPSKLAFFAVVAAVLQAWLPAYAYTMAFGGRLTEKDGRPVEGPVDLEVTFHDSENGGSSGVSPMRYSGVPLSDGIFSLKLD